MFSCRILGSTCLYDVLLVHTKNYYTDIIEDIDDDELVDKLDTVLGIAENIQDCFGIFLCVEISVSALFFTTWLYLALVDVSYGVCAITAIIRYRYGVGLFSFDGVSRGLRL